LCVGWLSGGYREWGVFYECFALERQRGQAGANSLATGAWRSGVAIQFFEEHGHFFFGLFVAVGVGGFLDDYRGQALLPQGDLRCSQML